MATPKVQPHFIVSLGKSLAQITSEFSPFPGYGLLVEGLCSILECVENVSQNRFAARQLAARAHCFLVALRDSEKDGALRNPRLARETAQIELSVILEKMIRWAAMGKVKSFLNQDEVSKEIVDCHQKLSDCITKLQLTTQFDILDWQKEHTEKAKQDHQELVEHLSAMETKQDLANVTLRDNNDMLRNLMTMMQTMMGENKQVAERIQHGLSVNLYALQQKTGGLLPNCNLDSGEVKRTGQFPVRGNSTMDIYEGIYLGKERVSMKAIRAMKGDERTIHRFKREGEIWAKVWERDHGRHIVPFYGFCQSEGPFPYMISPWQENGDALTYVKRNDHRIDYPKFLKQIALGVQLLHTFSPPIVHGDIKSANIMINDEGIPRLSDFGLSQIINDVAGTPFTQSSIVADSFRYFAPEVCTGSGVMSTMADIYALGMTVLEILTHQQPYSKIRMHTQAVVRAANGQRPDRPLEDSVVKRGMNEELWNCLVQCWSLEPEKRPTIEDFILVLDRVIDATPRR
ncbi:kinase-like protein [Coprinellus micaceus]|uniref:Kinase-like protein n=1 Tax=Coprinellus micaceus TaxID=71717 RepID=A0A4Y7TND8_COPMI|nr:kinase-like protein [Coprinellus micaceus]